MTSELKPCPFCLRPLKRSSGKFNPMAVCETDGCWMKEKQIAVPCDDPFSVKSWNTRAVPDVPELDRYGANRAEYFDGTMEKDPRGKYVLHSQAAEIIAAEQQKTKDAEELAFRMDRFATKYLRHKRNAEQRAETAEAKLAQYEAQEPVAWMHPEAGWTDVSKQEVAVHCKVGTYPLPLYDAPVSDSLKAECDRYKEALGLCQRTLAMIIDPKSIVSTTSIIAFASATEAEAKARTALKGESNV